MGLGAFREALEARDASLSVAAAEESLVGAPQRL
jgi:hypothetical protein